MKKFFQFMAFLACAILLLPATGDAVEFKVRGDWLIGFDYGAHGSFMTRDAKGNHVPGWNKNTDNFEANERVRMRIEALVSENLSGVLWFEFGQISARWGRASNGMALGADGTLIKVKNAYLDWTAPNTELKVRMGLQQIKIPFMATNASIFDDDVAAVSASYPLTENIGLTFFWARPFNDNFEGYTENGRVTEVNFQDNMDLFALLVPLTYDWGKITPWGMYGMIGPNTFRKATQDSNNPFGNTSLGDNFITPGMFAYKGALHRNGTSAIGDYKIDTYANAWWGGITGMLDFFDPLKITFDFVYGSVNWGEDSRSNRAGWLAALIAEYKLNWAIPGLYGWYASGDDNNPANGSERLPYMTNNCNNFSKFAWSGDEYIARDSLIGKGMSGTWGIGARLKNISSFIPDLKHTLHVNLIGGTNSPRMGKIMALNGDWATDSGILGKENVYMTTYDNALEFGLTNTWKVYENFTIDMHADYMALWLDTSDSVWGAIHRRGEHVPSVADAWNFNVTFMYKF